MPELLPEHLINSNITAHLPSQNVMFTLPGLLPMRAFEQVDVDDFAYSIIYYLKKYGKENIYLTDYPESFEPRFLNLVHAVSSKLIANYGMSPDNIKYVCGAIPIQENIDLYKQHCLKNNWIRVPVILVNYWEERMADYIRNHNHDMSNLDKVKKTKIFLSFNGGARLHRAYLMTYFFKNKLLDKSYFSMHTHMSGLWYIYKNLNYNDEWYKDYKKLLEYFIKSNPELPMILSLQPDNFLGQHTISKSDIALFSDSHISIINETSFFKKDLLGQDDMLNAHLDSIFVTEKTFRTIACKHPFIMVSRPFTLKHMRRLGYKTFSPYIDESYDEIENDYERLVKISLICKDLSTKKEDFWKQFQTQVQEIVLHNYNHLLSRQTYYISDETFSS